MRVLEAGDVEELQRKYQGVRQIKGMPEPKTKPSFVITPHRDAVMER